MAATGLSFSGTSSSSSSSSFGFSNPSLTPSATSFRFGAATTPSAPTTSLFGTCSSAASTPASSYVSRFGGPSQFVSSSGAAPTPCIFVSSSGTAFTSLFGSSSTCAHSPTSFGFNIPTPAPFLFGSGAPTPNLFGNSSATQPTTASLFGSAPPPFSGLFGSSTSASTATPTPSIFRSGAAPAPGLFGSSTTSSQTTTACTATSSLFGTSSESSPSPGLIGSSSLFGTSSAAPAFALFSSSTSSTTPSSSAFPATAFWSPIASTSVSPSSAVSFLESTIGSSPGLSSGISGSRGTSPTIYAPVVTSAYITPSSSFTGSGSISTSAPASESTISSSPSLKSPASAASSALQTQSSGALPSFGNAFSSCVGCCSNNSSIHLEVGLSGHGVSNEHELLHVVSPAGVEDEDEKGYVIIKEGDVVDGVFACTARSTTYNASTVAKKMISLTSQVHSFSTPMDINEGSRNEAAPVAQKQLTNEVVNGSVPLEPLPVSDLKHLSVESTLYPRKAILIKQMFEKYGDITEGSILKSIEAKAAFLHLVVEVVERLGSFNLEDSVDAGELEVIQKWTEDAAAVGFRVDWLQQRITKTVAVFKYQDELKQLNEKVGGAKKALLEMELQEMILKKEIDLIKSEMNLPEGLF